jgi:signal transduction histidine kinase
MLNAIINIANYLANTGAIALFVCFFCFAQETAGTNSVGTAEATTAPAVSPCQQPRLLTQAERRVSQGSQTIARDTVALPDALARAWRDERIQISYTLDVSDCTRNGGSALWLFRVGAPFQAQGDGVPLVSLLSPGRLGAGGALEEGATAPPGLASVFAPHAQPLAGGVMFNGRIPVLFGLPVGTQQVQIQFGTLPYIGHGLMGAFVGPTVALTPRAIAGIAQSVGYADAAAGVLLVLAALALLLWSQRRKDLGLLWVGVASALWSLRALAYFGDTVSFQPLWFEQFNPLNVMLTSAALSAAVFWIWGTPSARLKWTLIGLVALCGLSLLATAFVGQGALLARSVNLLAGFGFAAFSSVWIWRHRAAMPRGHGVALVMGYGVMIGTAGHDITLVAGFIPPTGPSLLFWGFTALLLVFAAISGEYILSQLRRAEHGNEELEQRVQAKSQELLQSYALLRNTEVAAARDVARAQERERLTRDMHDGMGAQLMTALRGVERGTLSKEQVTQSLQDGLDELRLLMDSSDQDQPLLTALANWRGRWDSRLAATGLTLEWDIDDSLEGLELAGDKVVQLMRVLQEAATNVVKHAQATRMAVKVSVVQPPAAPQRELHMALADDGIGMPEAQAREGSRGLKNMRFRAQAMGAHFGFGAGLDSTDGKRGCGVKLVLTLG